jgi:hypothetical protein
MTPNIYVYKCVVDDGTAPCIDRRFLSMTICKPKVRTSANVGDIVIAFGTNARRRPIGSRQPLPRSPRRPLEAHRPNLEKIPPPHQRQTPPLKLLTLDFQPLSLSGHK